MLPSGSHLKVAADNSQIQLRVKATGGLRPDPVPRFQRQTELLLVRGGGRQQRRLHAPPEPLRHRGIRLGHLFRPLAQVPGAAEENFLEFKTDYDDGRLEYEGELFYDGMKYEFTVDGYSGTIREWESEKTVR